MKNKKIVGEILIIPACVLYLILSLLKSGLASGIIATFFAIITAFWFVPKYVDELYVYESKYNFLKLIYIIGNILFAVSLILNLIFKLKIFKILIIVSGVIVLIELLHYGIKNLKEVITKTKEIGINILYSFSSFALFAIIISTVIIYLK